MRNYYKPGDWNAICQVCGFKFKASELKQRWDNLRVCSHDYEMRHPMDFLRLTPEKIGVPWVSKEPAGTYVPLPGSGNSVINGAPINEFIIG